MLMEANWLIVLQIKHFTGISHADVVELVS